MAATTPAVERAARVMSRATAGSRLHLPLPVAVIGGGLGREPPHDPRGPECGRDVGGALDGAGRLGWNVGGPGGGGFGGGVGSSGFGGSGPGNLGGSGVSRIQLPFPDLARSEVAIGLIAAGQTVGLVLLLAAWVVTVIRPTALPLGWRPRGRARWTVPAPA